MSEFRAGIGFDAHRFGTSPPIKLAGIVVDSKRGIEATSDGDVVAHAIADAILGACGLGDMGDHFPSDDPQSQDADSMVMLRTVFRLARAWRWWINSVDVTVIAEDVRISPHREAMTKAVSTLLECEAVSIKATTTDQMGAIGRGEGLAALAVVTITI
ncbi:MAG: 2-C-methyl-D-erythritol 2,4-cyclodiphosphate synthase [bacterium]